MKFEMIVERTSTGYSAYCETEGAYTVAKTYAELQANMVEALNLALSDTGRTVTMEDIKVTYDIPSLLEAYKVINAAALAKRIGMTQSLFSQYAAGTKKAGPKQTERILEGIRQVGRELAELELVY